MLVSDQSVPVEVKCVDIWGVELHGLTELLELVARGSRAILFLSARSTARAIWL